MYSRNNPPSGYGSAVPEQHQHNYSMISTDLVIVRWCVTCGETHKIERYDTTDPFPSTWQRVKEPQGL